MRRDIISMCGAFDKALVLSIKPAPVKPVVAKPVEKTAEKPAEKAVPVDPAPAEKPVEPQKPAAPEREEDSWDVQPDLGF